MGHLSTQSGHGPACAHDSATCSFDPACRGLRSHFGSRGRAPPRLGAERRWSAGPCSLVEGGTEMVNEKSGEPAKQSMSSEPQAHGASDSRKGRSRNALAPMGDSAPSRVSGGTVQADEAAKQRLLNLERLGPASRMQEPQPSEGSGYLLTDTSYGMSSIPSSVSEKSLFDLSSDGTNAKANSAHGSGLGNGSGPRSTVAKSDKTLTAPGGKDGKVSETPANGKGKGKFAKVSGANSRSQSPNPVVDPSVQQFLKKIFLQNFPRKIFFENF